MTKAKKKLTLLLTIGILLIISIFMGFIGINSLSARADSLGTESNPYVITTRQEFINVFSNNDNTVYGYYKLGNDIDMDWTEWNPSVENFAGTLDGNGKTIKNLVMYINNGGNHGLIRKLYGTVKNLTVYNLTVYSNISSYSGSICIGGIAGYNEGGTIYNCHVSDLEIFVPNIVTQVFVGGFVGYNNFGRVEYCSTSSDTALIADKYVGGIVGINVSGTITSCVNMGDVIFWYVSGVTPYVGGIAGAQINSGKIVNSQNYGTIQYNGSENSDKDFKPRMGQLLGLNASGCKYSECSIYGKVDSSNLKQSNGFLGIGKIDQKEFVSDSFVGEQL